MCRERRAARRACHNQHMAPIPTGAPGPSGTSMISQYGGYHAGPVFSNGRNCGRRRSHGQGPISGLVSFAKTLSQGKDQSQPQNQPRAPNSASKSQLQMGQQSYGIIQAASVPRAVDHAATATHEPEYEDEKNALLAAIPRSSEIPPTYDQAAQVQRAVLPEYDNVDAFAQLSLGQDRQPQQQQQQEIYPAEQFPAQRNLGQGQVDPRAMQSQISGRMAYKLQRGLYKAEEKLQKKADKYARKAAKAERKHLCY